MDSGFPMRINKYLAQKGYTTRRGADELVEKRKVTINGRIAILGDKVEEGDAVEVRSSGKKAAYRYFAYHKPRGIVSHSAQGDDNDIADEIRNDPLLLGTYPVGRLDKDSYGLIILTDDGRVTDRLLNPDKAHEKEYTVKTATKLRGNFKERMEAGVDIEGYMTKPAKVRINGDFSFSITLTEGKKHQIRRMVAAMFNEVKELKRIRVMNVRLGTLKAGEYRPIEGDELTEFLSSLGL
jgi:23S rRNA pseudouridine2604 synthase